MTSVDRVAAAAAEEEATAAKGEATVKATQRCEYKQIRHRNVITESQRANSFTSSLIEHDVGKKQGK